MLDSDQTPQQPEPQQPEPQQPKKISLKVLAGLVVLALGGGICVYHSVNVHAVNEYSSALKIISSASNTKIKSTVVDQGFFNSKITTVLEVNPAKILGGINQASADQSSPLDIEVISDISTINPLNISSTTAFKLMGAPAKVLTAGLQQLNVQFKDKQGAVINHVTKDGDFTLPLSFTANYKPFKSVASYTFHANLDGISVKTPSIKIDSSPISVIIKNDDNLKPTTSTVNIDSLNVEFNGSNLIELKKGQFSVALTNENNTPLQDVTLSLDSLHVNLSKYNVKSDLNITNAKVKQSLSLLSNNTLSIKSSIQAGNIHLPFPISTISTIDSLDMNSEISNIDKATYNKFSVQLKSSINAKNFDQLSPFNEKQEPVLAGLESKMSLSGIINSSKVTLDAAASVPINYANNLYAKNGYDKLIDVVSASIDASIPKDLLSNINPSTDQLINEKQIEVSKEGIAHIAYRLNSGIFYAFGKVINK